MDPISLVVTALVAGAAAGLKPMAETAIKDAYAGMKRLIQDKYDQVDINLLEKNPTSKGRQATVKEELEQTDVGQNTEVLHQAKSLLDAIQQHAPETAAAIGVTLQDIKGAALEIEDIIASGPGVIVERAELTDIKIKGVRAGQRGTDPN